MYWTKGLCIWNTCDVGLYAAWIIYHGSSYTVLICHGRFRLLEPCTPGHQPH